MRSIQWVIILFVVSCTITKKQSINMAPAIAFDTQGHRGCRGLMPENTIPAMIKALDLGVTTLEMDAVITKDSQVVLSHEPFFNHEISTSPDGLPISEATEKQHNIFQLDYAEVKRYDVGLAKHPRFPRQEKIAAVKPLLADVFDAADAHAKKTNRALPFYNIETKSQASTDNQFHPEPGRFVELMMHVIRQKKIEQRVIIQSFDVRTLQYLHQHYPHIQTAYLVERPSLNSMDAQINKLGFTPTIFSPEHRLVTTAMINYCREKKIKLIPWTVNELSTMQKLKDMGVDGIISDYPDLFAQMK
ncbi:MAG: glycerophosphodiester phosphodiesterase [Chitinophagales bacterium]|nr:glycerophosphodiester phosphodiesterase [Chitinophagales bacterium]